jgi:hypothetical protein
MEAQLGGSRINKGIAILLYVEVKMKELLPYQQIEKAIKDNCSPAYLEWDSARWAEAAEFFTVMGYKTLTANLDTEIDFDVFKAINTCANSKNVRKEARRLQAAYDKGYK